MNHNRYRVRLEKLSLNLNDVRSKVVKGWTYGYLLPTLGKRFVMFGPALVDPGPNRYRQVSTSLIKVATVEPTEGFPKTYTILTENSTYKLEVLKELGEDEEA